MRIGTWRAAALLGGLLAAGGWLGGAAAHAQTLHRSGQSVQPVYEGCEPGTYVIRAAADDGVYMSNADVTVVVTE